MSDIVTYKGLIKLFQDITANHLAVKYFNWGELTDIEVNMKNSPLQQYPYVFLNPVSVIFSKGYTTYNCNLIVFDLARDSREAEMEVHDTTLQILSDIFGALRNTTWESLPISVDDNLSAYWFVEKEKNSVSGWSANINLTVKNPLDLCNAAFTTSY